MVVGRAATRRVRSTWGGSAKRAHSAMWGIGQVDWIMEKVRIDKWLWAARFFKTRSLATQAVEGGRVRLNGERCKPAKEVRAGDRLLVHMGELEWELAVLALSDKRGPATVARNLYAESEQS